MIHSVSGVCFICLCLQLFVEVVRIFRPWTDGGVGGGGGAVARGKRLYDMLYDDGS